VTTVSLAGTASYLPERAVDNDFFGAHADEVGAMFRGTRRRHHVGAEETSTEMIARASERLAARLGLDFARDVDLILTNVSLPDQPFTGCGAAVSHRIGGQPKMILDLHNGGCVSFVYMMKVAQTLMAAGEIRTALLCNAQTAAGRIFAHPDNRARPQSAVPGDGCGVGYLVAGDESPVRAVVTRCHAEFAGDMFAACDDGGAYWDPRRSPMYIDFTEARIASIASRGNRMVPEMVRAACAAAGITASQIDLLITNQPNPIFLRNWRESLALDRSKQVDTFAEHGNLFGAAIPIAFERAEAEGRLRPGHHVALGGFAHAGDYAAAAIVHWRAKS
jgi:3-oxoacyl-[acyl-carrier-protein] synthase III